MIAQLPKHKRYCSEVNEYYNTGYIDHNLKSANIVLK